MATKKEETILEIKPLNKIRVPIKIVGDTPLIVHNWSPKAKRMMLEKQMKTTKTSAKEARDPFDDFINSMYWLTEQPESNPKAFEKAVKKGAKWGFKVSGIKQAGNSAAYRMKWVKNQAALRGTYFLNSDYGDLVEIKGCVPEMREDMCKIAGGTADLRYRAEYKNWYMDLEIEFNDIGELTLEQIINIMNLGGYACGIGEWRPERDGTFGKYHVETA